MAKSSPEDDDLDDLTGRVLAQRLASRGVLPLHKPRVLPLTAPGTGEAMHTNTQAARADGLLADSATVRARTR